MLSEAKESTYLMIQTQKPSAFASLVKSKWTERVVDLILVPLLLLYSLWLPPASIGVRLFHLDQPLITPDGGGTVIGPNGARLRVPPGALVESARIRLEALGDTDLSKMSTSGARVFAASAAGSRALTVRPDS